MNTEIFNERANEKIENAMPSERANDFSVSIALAKSKYESPQDAVDKLVALFELRDEVGRFHSLLNEAIHKTGSILDKDLIEAACRKFYGEDE